MDVMGQTNLLAPAFGIKCSAPFGFSWTNDADDDANVEMMQT
jgi:hypothetical protein